MRLGVGTTLSSGKLTGWLLWFELPHHRATFPARPRNDVMGVRRCSLQVILRTGFEFISTLFRRLLSPLITDSAYASSSSRCGRIVGNSRFSEDSDARLTSRK